MQNTYDTFVICDLYFTCYQGRFLLNLDEIRIQYSYWRYFSYLTFGNTDNTNHITYTTRRQPTPMMEHINHMQSPIHMSKLVSQLDDFGMCKCIGIITMNTELQQIDKKYNKINRYEYAYNT